MIARAHANGSRGTLARWALAAAAVAHFSVFLWMPSGGFWINDEGTKFIQVDGLVRSGFSRLAIDWPGRALDPDLAFGPLTEGFKYVADGELYAAYSPVFAVLAAPFYAVFARAGFGLAGLHVLPLAGALLSLLAVAALARRVASPARTGSGGQPAQSGNGATSERTAALAVLAAGFCTPLFWYGQTFWEHAPAIACSCASFLACVRHREEQTASRAAAVAAFAGLAVWLRPDAYLLALVVLLFTWLGARHRLRDALVLAIGFAAVLAPVWLFHALAFGDPLGPHIRSQPWAGIGVAGYLASRVQTALNLLVQAHGNQGWSAVAALPFFAVLLLRPALGGARLSAARLSAAVPIAALAGFLAGGIVLAGHLAAARPMNWLMISNGLFAASPLCILGLLPNAWDRTPPDAPQRARSLLFRIAVVYAALFALLVPEVNSRGIHWGNRFLLPIYPLLSVLAAATIVAWFETGREDRRKSERAGAGPGRSLALAAVGAVVLVSVALQVYSLVLLHDRKAFTSALNDRVAASGERIVVTDTWFVPVDLARVFHEQAIFFVPRAQRGAFRTLAREHGVERALSIERVRTGARQDGSGAEVSSEGVSRLDDGWLGFSSVTLRVVDLAPSSETLRTQRADGAGGP